MGPRFAYNTLRPSSSRSVKICDSLKTGIPSYDSADVLSIDETVEDSIGELESLSITSYKFSSNKNDKSAQMPQVITRERRPITRERISKCKYNSSAQAPQYISRE